MNARLDLAHASPASYRAMYALSTHVNSCGLEPALLELVKTRASQINGCAFCLDMHTRDARKAGETEQRLHLLPVWRETGLYSARERAALAWCEALTELAGRDIDDALYDTVRTSFSEQEIVDLSVAVVTINGWNRLAKAFQLPVQAAAT